MCERHIPAGEMKAFQKCKATVLIVMSNAKLATLETDAMKAAAGAGAPS